MPSYVELVVCGYCGALGCGRRDRDASAESTEEVERIVKQIRQASPPVRIPCGPPQERERRRSSLNIAKP